MNRVCADGADTVVISVKDTGIGISPANIEKLFTDFSQAEVSTATKYGGTGLGLALCRSLCQPDAGRDRRRKRSRTRLDLHGALPAASVRPRARRWPPPWRDAVTPH